MNTPLRVLKPWKTTTLDDIHHWPKGVSEKLDGIRCWVRDGIALTASNKPIPNEYISSTLSDPRFDGFDGEIICGTFRETTSAVMSEGGRPDFTYHVFDNLLVHGAYESRYTYLYQSAPQYPSYIRVLEHDVVHRDDAQRALEVFLAAGAEGICLRDMSALWRSGRCPRSSEALVAVKPLADAEAYVIGAEPLYHNANLAEINELGLSKRSLCQEGRIPCDELGALIVEGFVTFDKQVFKIGTGFTADDRKRLWQDHLHNRLVGAMVRYRYLPVGGYVLPRQPRFTGFRKDLT